MKTKSVLVILIMMLKSIQSLNIDIIPSQKSFSKSDKVEVLVKYENNGPDTIYIRSIFFPNGPLFDSILKVTCDGEEVAYSGRTSKRVPDTINNSVSVPSGASIKAKIDVSSEYDLTKTGRYKIEVNADPEQIILNDPQAVSPRDESLVDDRISSSIVSVEGRDNVPVVTNTSSDSTASRGLSGYVSCSPSQKLLINSAFSTAVTYAKAAQTYLTSNTPSNRPRYVTWFGAYTSSLWNTAKTNFQKIATSLQSDSYVIDCSCTSSGTYAYVYRNSPYKIYVCGAFWSASTYGTDSKAGTIIHEASHFTVVANTDDNAYGQTACKNLANTSPTKAVQNADSHEYFAENTPNLA